MKANTYKLALNTTEGHVTTKVYTDANPVDKDNPSTLVKRYSRGQLTRVITYDENSEVTSDWKESSNKAHRMFTDRLSGTRRIAKNIPTYLLINLCHTESIPAQN